MKEYTGYNKYKRIARRNKIKELLLLFIITVIVLYLGALWINANKQIQRAESLGNRITNIEQQVAAYWEINEKFYSDFE